MHTKVAVFLVDGGFRTDDSPLGKALFRGL
jgi:hypothetical protein